MLANWKNGFAVITATEVIFRCIPDHDEAHLIAAKLSLSRKEPIMVVALEQLYIDGKKADELFYKPEPDAMTAFNRLGRSLEQGEYEAMTRDEKGY